MIKVNIFGLCNGVENSSQEETVSGYIVSNMKEEEISEKWNKYYWSMKYKNFDSFVKKLKRKGVDILKLEEIPNEFIKIEVI